MSSWIWNYNSIERRPNGKSALFTDITGVLRTVEPEAFGSCSFMAAAGIHQQIDYHTTIDLTDSAIRNHPERVMILAHEHDTAFGPPVHRAVKHFYPGARAYLLPDYGHVATMVRADTILTLLNEFFG